MATTPLGAGMAAWPRRIATINGDMLTPQSLTTTTNFTLGGSPDWIAGATANLRSLGVPVANITVSGDPRFNSTDKILYTFDIQVPTTATVITTENETIQTGTKRVLIDP